MRCKEIRPVRRRDVMRESLEFGHDFQGLQGEVGLSPSISPNRLPLREPYGEGQFGRVTWEPGPAVAQLLVSLQHIEHELLLFAAFWFVLGLVDELAVDLAWLWLKLTGRVQTGRLSREAVGAPLSGDIAVFIPAWQEAQVIAVTVAHMLEVWPQAGLRLYVGCYRNDVATLVEAMAGTAGDPRVRLVIHARHGPTTKADCLNRLHQAMLDDEVRSGRRIRGIVLHDAEDMVHPAALPVIDRALSRYHMVQLPVRPEPQRGSRLVAGHYCDEFIEAHAKSMVVRDALGAGIPAAGVGCGVSRAALGELAALRRAEGDAGPFAADCLTEDYELGMILSYGPNGEWRGRGSRFLRLRDADGALVATRAYFPARLPEAVRQKTRWIHGIALQGWERLGWSGGGVDVWMALRDRRGPLIALVLAAGYALVVVEGLLAIGAWFGLVQPVTADPALRTMLLFGLMGCLWRMAMRFAFTAREYGWLEGLLGIVRIPIGNVVAIMAGRRALVAYIRTLAGGKVTWDKTRHSLHPARNIGTGLQS